MNERQTKQRGCEEELAKLRTAVEQTSESIVITDREGVIQFVNSAFERISGYGRDEIVGSNLRSIRKERGDGEVAGTILREMLRRGEEWKGRFVNRKKDGLFYEVDSIITPVRNQEGAVISFVAVERDVTQESQLEKHLRQVQKMEALGTLAGGIAHDFKNLLVPIMLHTELALSDPDLKSSTRRSLKQAFNSCHNANNLVQQILTFSRRGSGERKPVEMDFLISDTLRLIQPLFPKNIKVYSHLPLSPEKSFVMADPSQLQQVVVNLCNNAVQAMHEEGGVLSVSLNCVDLDLKKEKRFPIELESGPYIRLAVTDTGQGMDNIVIEKIFEPFFTTKASGQGTGLGLAVVYGIVRKHGGAISVSSKPGKGSSFEVFFPKIESKQALEHISDRTPPLKSVPVPGGKEHILFVDDEQPVCESVGALLAHLGYQVTLAQGGAEALELFRNDPGRFDLVITDFAMPSMTGVELARELSRIRPGLPTILCTAFQEVCTLEARESGIRDLAPKPIIIGELAKSIRRVLEKPR